MVVNTQFHKSYGRSFAVFYIYPHEGYKPETPLDAALGRCESSRHHLVGV